MKTAKTSPGAIRRDRDGLRRCRICGCTERDACSNGCSWVDANLCSTCGQAANELLFWMIHARRPNKTALFREVARASGAGV